MEDIFFNIFLYTDIIILNKITEKLYHQSHLWIQKLKQSQLPQLYKTFPLNEIKNDSNWDNTLLYSLIKN